MVYSSPLWVGRRNGNTMERIGFSHKSIQHFTQNVLIHKNGFIGLGMGQSPYFLDYSKFTPGFYVYTGYYNPYSLYGR